MSTNTIKISDLPVINTLTGENLQNIYFLATLSNNTNDINTRIVNYNTLSNSILNNININIPGLENFTDIQHTLTPLNNYICNISNDIKDNIDFRNNLINTKKIETLINGLNGNAGTYTSSITSYVSHELTEPKKSISSLNTDVTLLSTSYINLNTVVADLTTTLNVEMLVNLNKLNGTNIINTATEIGYIMDDIYGIPGSTDRHPINQDYYIIDNIQFVNTFLSSVNKQNPPVINQYIRDTLDDEIIKLNNTMTSVDCIIKDIYNENYILGDDYKILKHINNTMTSVDCIINDIYNENYILGDDHKILKHINNIRNFLSVVNYQDTPNLSNYISSSITESKQLSINFNFHTKLLNNISLTAGFNQLSVEIDSINNYKPIAINSISASNLANILIIGQHIYNNNNNTYACVCINASQSKQINLKVEITYALTY